MPIINSLRPGAAVTVAGYTTTFDCIKRNYPFRECITNLLQFCDQVSVVDGGSTDGTIEELVRLSRTEQRLKFSIHPVDFSHPRWAIHMDGYLKAKARAQCETEYCWQTDNDEIVPEADFGMIRQLPAALGDIFKERPVLYLPMVEFWGGFQTIRADFFSWKPRFSINDPCITHGIPKALALTDQFGHEYPRPFDSDSCNYIWRDTRESVPMALPVPRERINNDPAQIEALFNEYLEKLPSVLHVSWLNLERKIAHYREFWPKFHASMYNLPHTDSAELNVMFNKPWSAVSDQDITEKARELAILGPRSFHRKMDPTKRGLTIPYLKPIPQSLITWAERTGMTTCRGATAGQYIPAAASGGTPPHAT